MRIIFFGDSITHGFFDRQGGWAQRIINDYHWQSYEQRDQPNAQWVECFNLGISGDTAAGVLRRLPSEFAARQLYQEDNILVIAIGTNDTVITEGKPFSNPQAYRQTMERIADQASQLAKQVMLVGLPSIDEELCQPWKYSSTKKSYTNQRIKQFDDQLAELCDQRGLTFVEIFDEFKAGDQASGWLSDGLHPNEAGHTFIASRVKSKLDKLLKEQK